jgi:hypothetical protein
MLKIYSLCIFFTFPALLSAQLKLEQADQPRIGFRSLEMLLQHNAGQGYHFFQELSPACYDASQAPSYSWHVKSYRIDKNIEEVWQGYKNADPSFAWGGRMVRFGFLYSAASDSLYYPGDKYGGAEEGQIVFINLKIGGGMRNLGVAFRINEINEENKIIRFCYMKHGKSEGTQTLRFEAAGENTTLVYHETQYRSGSRFRDRRIYPKFHTDAIGEFHKNVKEWMEKQAEQTSEK